MKIDFLLFFNFLQNADPTFPWAKEIFELNIKNSV